ncbi:MAG TPA: glycosyltransferase family 2 protein [Micromonosporaceae bacterium]
MSSSNGTTEVVPAPRPAADIVELPSVGVVIPTRNRPELMRRALDAVLAQDYAGTIRVIVAYDGSTPDYMLPRAEPHPVMVLQNWRTPGLAGTRNTGVLGLDTDLVAFCDDDDQWLPGKLTAQVNALIAAPPGTEFVTCAIEVEHEGNYVPRLAGQDTVYLDDLIKSRMAMLHSSTFLARRSAMLGGLGLVAEEAPGSQNEDWDMLLRASKRAPIVHVDEPLVRVLWANTSHFAYEYATKISSLRWMMSRHPEIRGCRPGAARVYGQLACWSAASGNRRDAWHFTREAVRNNWKEPRAAIAIAAATGVVSVDKVLGALHRRGHGI